MHVLDPQPQPDLNQDILALLCDLASQMGRATVCDDVSVTPQRAGRSPATTQAIVMIYASIATSMLAAFFTPFGKQWSDRYISVPVGASAIERGLNRDRKLDGWLLYPLIQFLQFVRMVAVFLYICGLSRLLLGFNTILAWVILGVIWFIVLAVSIFIAVLLWFM